MSKGLVFYTEQYVVAVVKNALEASARDHIVNGYPELVDDFASGTVMVREINLPDKTVLTDCSFDGERFIPLEPEAKINQDAYLEARSNNKLPYDKLMEKVERETKRFIANRLLDNARITPEEYDMVIARIGQD